MDTADKCVPKSMVIDGMMVPGAGKKDAINAIAKYLKKNVVDINAKSIDELEGSLKTNKKNMGDTILVVHDVDKLINENPRRFGDLFD